MKNKRHTRPRYTYADYDQAKREWLANNRAATHTEYEQACQRIAARMGL